MLGPTNSMGSERSQIEENENIFSLVLHHPLATFLAGFRFLTIIPVPWSCEQDGRFFKSSLFFFPLIGLFIGAFCSGVVALCSSFLPAALTVLLGLLLLAAISGGLHLDGLADSFDGLLSSRPRERALEIMRDSHIGAMGVIGLIFLILAKFAALLTLPQGTMIQALLLMPLIGRTAIVLSMALLPYARKGTGLGLLFYSSSSRRVAASGLLFAILAVLLVSFEASILIFLGLLLTVGFFSWWSFAKLGGATGDTLGAVCELSELSVAVSLSIAFAGP